MKVVVICASSIDGKIAGDSTDPLAWVPREDRAFFARETKRIGVVVMGHNTHRTIGRALPARLNIVMTRAAGLAAQPAAENLEFTAEQPHQLLQQLVNRGFGEVAVIGGAQVNTAFLRAKAIDEIWLSLIPVVLGRGIGLFAEACPFTKLEHFATEMLGAQTLLVRYGVRYE